MEKYVAEDGIYGTVQPISGVGDGITRAEQHTLGQGMIYIGLSSPILG